MYNALRSRGNSKVSLVKLHTYIAPDRFKKKNAGSALAIGKEHEGGKDVVYC